MLVYFSFRNFLKVVMSDLDQTYESDSDDEISPVGSSEVLVKHFDPNEDSITSSDQEQSNEESDTDDPNLLEHSLKENGASTGK